MRVESGDLRGRVAGFVCKGESESPFGFPARAENAEIRAENAEIRAENAGIGAENAGKTGRFPLSGNRGNRTRTGGKRDRSDGKSPKMRVFGNLFIGKSAPGCCQIAPQYLAPL